MAQNQTEDRPTDAQLAERLRGTEGHCMVRTDAGEWLDLSTGQRDADYMELATARNSH